MSQNQNNHLEFSWKRIFYFFALLALAGCVTVFIASLLSEYFTLADNLAHLFVQAGWAGIFSLIIFAVLKEKKLAMVSIIAVAFYVFQLSPFLFHQQPESFSEKPLKLLTFNVLTMNTEYQKVSEYLMDSDADIILLQEVDQYWINQFSKLREKYPEYIEHPRFDNFGMAAYSRVPLKSKEIVYYDDSLSPLPGIKLGLEWDGQTITFFNVHTLPPLGNFNFRNRQLKKLATMVKSTPTPVVVAGDFNMTPWTYYYKKFLDDSGLLDTQVYSGLQSSWPVPEKLFGMPLDHVFVNSMIVTRNRQIGENLESDHYPVSVELAVKKR